MGPLRCHWRRGPLNWGDLIAQVSIGLRRAKQNSADHIGYSFLVRGASYRRCEASLRTGGEGSVREDLNIELGNVFRVGDCVDGGDLAIGDGEPQQDAQLALQHDRQSHGAVDKG